MNLKYFIDRPILSAVISVGMVLLGVLALFSLPVEQYPDIAPPTVSVFASYPGANAETVQKAVVVPLEDAVNGVEGMTYITSTASNSGDADLLIYFKQGTDPDMAAVNVQNRVSTALSLLPSEVVQVGVTTEKQQNAELKTFAIYDPEGRYDNIFLDNYMKIHVEPRIKRIGGVGKFMLFGSGYSMRIWLRPDKMAHYRLVPSDISEVLAAQNIEAATGSFGENGDNVFQYTMKYRGRLSTPEEFGNLVIRSLPNGEVLRLKEVADIELGSEAYNFHSTINGKPCALAMAYQTAGSNASAVIKEIDAALEEMGRELPEGLEFITISDTNRFLYASIKGVVVSLLLAVVLVVLVVYLFLQNIRSTLIPVIAIFVSIISSFAFIAAAGFSINLLTLFALVLAVGTVVDNAIIVVEAVQSRFDAGYGSARKATFDAMDGISSAIIVSTLIFMAVFIPTSFMGGTSGTFYKQFGITMAAAVGLSAINALTLSPALCVLMLKPSVPTRFSKAYDTAFRALLHHYKNGVLFFVRRKRAVWAILTAGLAALVLLVKYTPTGFIPDEDVASLMISIDTKPGSSLTETNRIMETIDGKLAEFPEIEYSGGISGYSLNGAGPSTGMYFIKLTDWNKRKGAEQSAAALSERIYGIAADVPDANMFVMMPPMIPGYGMGGGFELYLQDKVDGDLSEFKAICDSFVEALNKRPEIESAYSSFATNYPQYWVDIDAAQCERAGITPAEVLNVLSGYYGGDYVSNFNRFSKLYRVMMQADPANRITPESLNHFYVRVGDEMAPLSQFIKLTKTYGPESLSRFNLYNSIAISGNAASGYSSGDALKAIRQTADKVLTRNYGYELGGISREQATTGNNTTIIFIVCIMLVYLILSGMYESLILPFTVILSVPCGLTGSFLFAKLFGLENNIYLQTGIIMLIGLLAKTAILITDYAGERRRSGMSLKRAAVEAAKNRLRPILMTALTMIFGMLPLMFASGVGANGNSTLGTGAVGGMLVGTLVLLFIVPALWMLFQSVEERIKPTKAKQKEEE